VLHLKSKFRVHKETANCHGLIFW